MEPFTKALEVVARVMRDGAATHPDNDWIRRSPEYHLGRAEEHLRLWREGDQLQDHGVPCSDAATNGLNPTRTRMIGAPGHRLSRARVVSSISDLPPTGRYQPRSSGLHRDEIGFRSPPIHKPDYWLVSSWGRQW